MNDSILTEPRQDVLVHKIRRNARVSKLLFRCSRAIGQNVKARFAPPLSTLQRIHVIFSVRNARRVWRTRIHTSVVRAIYPSSTLRLWITRLDQSITSSPPRSPHSITLSLQDHSLPLLVQLICASNLTNPTTAPQLSPEFASISKSIEGIDCRGA